MTDDATTQVPAGDDESTKPEPVTEPEPEKEPEPEEKSNEEPPEKTTVVP